MLTRFMASALLLVASQASFAAPPEAKFLVRAEKAAAALNAFKDAPDHAVPAFLEKMRRAKCVAVIPSEKKVALGIGLDYGAGLAACKTDSGWSRPSYVQVRGVSAGHQIGAKATDLVLVFYGREAPAQLSRARVKLGASAAAAFFPVGRETDADTDWTLRAEIISYSRSRGLFLGWSVDAGWLNPDTNANSIVYTGKKLDKHVPTAAGLSPQALLTTSSKAQTQDKNLQQFVDALPTF